MALLRKITCNSRHPITLRHPVSKTFQKKTYFHPKKPTCMTFMCKKRPTYIYISSKEAYLYHTNVKKRCRYYLHDDIELLSSFHLKAQSSGTTNTSKRELHLSKQIKMNHTNVKKRCFHYLHDDMEFLLSLSREAQVLHKCQKRDLFSSKQTKMNHTNVKERMFPLFT